MNPSAPPVELKKRVEEHVMDLHLWSLPVALAWILWRTPEAVLNAHPDWNETIGLPAPSICDIIELAARAGGTVVSLRTAKTEFWSALTKCKLKALARCERTGEEIYIPKSAWPDLTIEDVTGSYLKRHHALKLASTGEIRFTHVCVPRDQLMTMWRLMHADITPLMPAPPLPKRNLGGRKLKVPQKEFNEIVTAALNDKGDFLGSPDPKWNSQGDLERYVKGRVKTLYGEKSVPGKSQTRSRIQAPLARWREKQRALTTQPKT